MEVVNDRDVVHSWCVHEAVLSRHKLAWVGHVGLVLGCHRVAIETVLVIGAHRGLAILRSELQLVELSE